MFIAYPFAAYLYPSDTIVSKRVKEIDLSGLNPGELGEYYFHRLPIWVYRRTQDQIDWLDEYDPPKVHSLALRHLNSESYGGKYRSIDPEYFVFSAFQHDHKTYLQQEGYWYQCGTIKYHNVEMKVKDGRTLNGVIACLSNHEHSPHEDLTHVYDVTGIAVSEYVNPLSVPQYKILANGNIQVGPKL